VTSARQDKLAAQQDEIKNVIDTYQDKMTAGKANWQPVKRNWQLAKIYRVKCVSLTL
jgi:hypothetical protein